MTINDRNRRSSTWSPPRHHHHRRTSSPRPPSFDPLLFTISDYFQPRHNNLPQYHSHQVLSKSDLELPPKMDAIPSDRAVSDGTDSGYAWVIPIVCCYINAILFGSYRAYGILYSVLLDTYHVNRSQAAWPFSLCMTVIHLTGPISGSLNSKFSTRTIMTVGCALSALGCGLCYTATSVGDITLYVGVVQGFGIGLTYVQNNAILNQYFVKFRATANGELVIS